MFARTYSIIATRVIYRYQLDYPESWRWGLGKGQQISVRRCPALRIIPKQNKRTLEAIVIGWPSNSKANYVIFLF